MTEFQYAAFVMAAAAAVPATAQDGAPPSRITIGGSAGLVSDYRFRSGSLSDEDMAVQAGLTVTDASDFYVGTWGSNLSGWGTFGGSNMELDAIGGYKHTLSDNAVLDVTAKAHIGHSWGNDGLGPNATSVTPTGDYWDGSVGADATYRNLTVNVSYIDTDISRRDAAYLQPSFSKGQDGTGSIADGTIVLSLSAAV